MSITDALMEAVQNLPNDKQQEVLDFADFLQARAETSGPPTPKIPLPPQSNLSALLQRWRQEDAPRDEEAGSCPLICGQTSRRKMPQRVKWKHE